MQFKNGEKGGETTFSGSISVFPEALVDDCFSFVNAAAVAQSLTPFSTNNVNLIYIIYH